MPGALNWARTTSAEVAIDTPARCRWVHGDPVEIAYHDSEWGVPVHDSRALWEMLMLEGFQAGLSWRTILLRRDSFRAAFANFDPEAVARFGPADVEALLQDTGIIRSRSKIESTIAGARIFLDRAAAGEQLATFAWGFVDGTPLLGDGVHVPAQTPLSQTISRELRARGYKFVGPVIVYAWMQAVGLVNDHAADCFRRSA